jgi:hypothetical protein
VHLAELVAPAAQVTYVINLRRPAASERPRMAYTQV